MNKQITTWLLALAALPAFSQQATLSSPDSHLKVDISLKQGLPVYAVSYKNQSILEDSPLGVVANVGDFSKGLTYVTQQAGSVSKAYQQDRIKQSHITYQANSLTYEVKNGDGQHFTIEFQVSNNDVAFRYSFPKYGDTGSIVIQNEVTGFDFPSVTTTFLTPQSDPMIGWKRTKPSYEEDYTVDQPLGTPSQYGKGYTFPGLFRIGDNGWALVSETGVGSRYCGSRLSEGSADGLFTIEFPMAEENNGNGTVAPAFSLPGSTPWRTITVGDKLAPIVETTIAWDLVEPLYPTQHNYRMGKGTWSWILWQDNSINYDDLVKFIDLSAAMGYQYSLVDNWWDTNLGKPRMEELMRYAKSKNVDPIIWYSSSGYWNDIVQGPTNVMDNPISRKAEMRWLQQNGAKGIKVDFFGGDKQETMRLYEAILSDADDHGLMVIFHGCTLPRGWERMYPNFVGSEAVLASENLVFEQRYCDAEAFNTTLHPFIRNSVATMEYGGVFLNKRLNRGNDGGTYRRTTDAFQLAQAVLFQSPVQNFALAPNNLTDAPAAAIEFMKQVPTTWDEVRHIDGYPGRYTILARRSGTTWYIAGTSALKEPLKLKLDLSALFNKGDKMVSYADDKALNLQKTELIIKNPAAVEVTLQPQGGFAWINY
ncbi:MAG: glycoside hydrolase family 97 catalytic domain-containing protein [Phocaeicola sp.]